MNIQELKTSLPILIKEHIVPFIWGQQGIGKTQVVKQIAKERELDFIHLHLATQEVGDLVGLLIETKQGNVKHARPEWFPTEGKGILFLDELNRAHPDVLQAMFSLITEGTIHTHKLPEGWSIVAAGNYQSNMFNVTDTSDVAWMSRFCHIDFEPTTEEFILHAENCNNYSVADFIRIQPELLEVKHKERLNTSFITPDRRSWIEMVSKLERYSELESISYELYSGIVGQTAAASFITFKKKATDKIRGRDVLNSYDKVRDKILSISKTKETRFDLLNSAAEEILAFLPEKTINESCMNNFKQFILDIPLEMGLKVINKLHSAQWTQKNEILNEKKFVELFKKSKLKSKK